MDLEQLKTFKSLASSRNFTRTAEEMNVVQSTVTARIKLLEEEIGEKLFIRKTRSVEITEEGKTFLVYVQQALEIMSEGIKTTRIQSRFDVSLVIGGMNSLWDTQIFDQIHQYQSYNPKTALRLISGHSEDIIEKIRYGLIDVGFVYKSPWSSQFNVSTVRTEAIHLVGASHIVSEIDSLKSNQLKEMPFIHYNWGTEFSDWFKLEVGEHEAMRFRVDHSAVALRLLLKGEGIGFMLESIIKNDEEKGLLSCIPFISQAEIPKQNVYMIFDKHKKEKVTSFVQYILDSK
ncbi:LysR family transcriptional repressor of citA [Virgibacillus halotolerans]|uniref:LysR family transcriptional regulator n=1 Tax=Virgibacillus halotolerans TaxID=1071053 RepID=UPI001961ADA6|nr:LysR family transcriptional repressor of citA [Virgibacillus halotolerans]